MPEVLRLCICVYLPRRGSSVSSQMAVFRARHRMALLRALAVLFSIALLYSIADLLHYENE